MATGMASPLPPRAARDPDLAVVALGLAVLAAIVLVDWLLRDTVTLTPWVLIAPMFIATRGSERETAVIAAIAFAVAIGLGAMNGTFGHSIHFMHLALVAAGGSLAVITARIRRRLDAAQRRTSQLLDRERAERVRQEFASRASGLLEAPLDAMTMLTQVAGLAVPDMADLCIVDLLEPDGTLKGVAISAADPADAEALRDQRMRYPLDPAGEHPVAIAARTGSAQLLPELPEENLRRYAASDEHLALMLRLRYSSAMVVPLSARGRTLGVISQLRLGGDIAYDELDFAVARDLARRAALAVDNARLFNELRSTEGQLEAILAHLSEAVTVQDSSGELVYANQAAADIMGSPTPQELLATPVAEIGARFWQFDEDGKPFPPDAYPGRLALNGDRPESVVMRQVDRTTGAERWVRLAATPIVIEGGGGARLSVTVTEDITDVVHIARRQRFLSSASKLLASSLDVEATIEKVAWAVIPEFADWCAVHLPDDQGNLRRMAVAHMSPAGVERFEELAQELVARTAPGESHLETVADPDADDDEVLSAAIVPLVAPGERERGTITLVSAGRGRRLGPADLSLMEELGRRSGVAVANARVHAARAHIATTLQRSLLPPRLPVIPGLEIAARFRAAGVAAEVGGDFYDLFLAESGWMIVIGDVTGKGPGAAAITSLARYTMRTAAMYESTPEKVLERLNHVLLADGERRQLCTAVALHVATNGGSVRLQVACAGHPAPYLLRPGHAAEPAGHPGTLLGAFDDVTWEPAQIDLHEGDVIVLYTDGVTDTRGATERFGQARLKELLDGCEGLAPDDVASRIDQALLEFEEGPQRDDVALLVLRATGVSR
jgi:PAS domain S-box-containing protein